VRLSYHKIVKRKLLLLVGLKVSDKAKDYDRVGVLKSGMHTAVLKEINSTCECFSKEVILEEFEAYFEVLEREVFHEVLR
jgi:hypothetical protein